VTTPPGEAANRWEDRRTEARLGPGDVECEIEGAQFVHVLGLTHEGTGMRVMTNSEIPKEQALPVTLHLSESDTLRFQARAVWSQEENFEFTRRYISGLKIEDIGADDSNRLKTFIQSLETAD